MSVFFNPAGPLTVNNIPYSLGGGRLGNSGITWDGVNTIKVPGAGSAGATHYGFINASGYGMYYPGGTSLAFSAGGVEILRMTAGVSLFGTTTDSSNGRVQIASHSAFTGGLAFGTVATGTESIWRSAAGTLRTAARLEFAPGATVHSLYSTGSTLVVQNDGGAGILAVGQLHNAALGYQVLNLTGRPTGWGTPSGTLTRTTFDTATVTLPLLAERLAALISDLKITHGVIAA